MGSVDGTQALRYPMPHPTALEPPAEWEDLQPVEGLAIGGPCELLVRW